MKGLCHKCMTSNIEVIVSKGEIFCHDCFKKLNAKN